MNLGLIAAEHSFQLYGETRGEEKIWKDNYEAVSDNSTEKDIRFCTQNLPVYMYHLCSKINSISQQYVI